MNIFRPLTYSFGKIFDVLGKVALKIVFRRKKTIRIVNSLFCELKQGQKIETSDINIHLNNIKFNLKHFFGRNMSKV